ncbi:MAG: cyclic nucleotide-binding domain-containing protein [Ignavibacteriaceae bacterium]|nr:cyclic nucleotide-binding domain-containing protein [Ignavibacteriaceae bacterium]
MKEFVQGRVIVKEGEIGSEFYILLSGSVGVFKNGKKIAEISAAGSTIGELSGILSTPRTATVMALEDCAVEVVTSDIDTLIKENPELLKKILYFMAQRLSATTSKLAEITEVFEHLGKRVF